MAPHGQPGAPERTLTMTNGRSGLVVGTGDYVYDVISPWGTLPAGMTLGVVSHVAVDSRDRVYFYQRKDPPILVFDGEIGRASCRERVEIWEGGGALEEKNRDT